MNSFMNFGVARFQSSKFPPTSWLNVVGWVPKYKFQFWLIRAIMIIRPVLSGVLTYFKLLVSHYQAHQASCCRVGLRCSSTAGHGSNGSQLRLSCIVLSQSLRHSATVRVGLRHSAQTRPRPGPLVERRSAAAVKQAGISESDSDCQPESRRGPVTGQLIIRVRDSESSLA